MLYAGLDAKFAHWTRFYAAASLVNGTFARWVRAASAVGMPRCIAFLQEAGSVLESLNLSYARKIGFSQSGQSLDHALVRAEQRELQHQVRLREVSIPGEWASIRGELNVLLNAPYLPRLSRWCLDAGTLGWILRHARQQAGRELDFATEAHRVSVGLMLVDHIRHERRRPRTS